MLKATVIFSQTHLAHSDTYLLL